MKQLVIEDLYKLPEILREERIKQHKTQHQIAIRARVGINTIYLTENGKCTPGLYVLSSWVRALGYEELVIKC